jgi:hypothetical protein
MHSLLDLDYVHIMLGATALFLPAPGPPACTLRARLNSKAAIRCRNKAHSVENQKAYYYVGRYWAHQKRPPGGQRPPAAHS